MTTKPSQFESTVISGSTKVFGGPTNVTPLVVNDIPAVAGNFIQKYELINQSTTLGDDIEISMDGGTTFFVLDPDNAYEWSPKSLRQLKVRSPIASVPFQVTIDFESF